MLYFRSKHPERDFPCLVQSESELCAPNVPGLNALNTRAFGDRLTIFDTKFIIGFDFATTRSSSPGFSSYIWLFDMVLDSLIELRWLPKNIEKTRKHSYSWTRNGWKLPCVNMSSCFWVSTYLIRILGVQINSVKKPIMRDTVDSVHVFHGRTSAFIKHLDYGFIVLKGVMQGAKVRRFCVRDNVTHIE